MEDVNHVPLQTLYQKLRKLLEPYEPQWCVEHEDWSLYVFAPHNR